MRSPIIYKIQNSWNSSATRAITWTLREFTELVRTKVHNEKVIIIFNHHLFLLSHLYSLHKGGIYCNRQHRAYPAMKAQQA